MNCVTVTSNNLQAGVRPWRLSGELAARAADAGSILDPEHPPCPGATKPAPQAPSLSFRARGPQTPSPESMRCCKTGRHSEKPELRSWRKAYRRSSTAENKNK